MLKPIGSPVRIAVLLMSAVLPLLPIAAEATPIAPSLRLVQTEPSPRRSEPASTDIPVSPSPSISDVRFTCQLNNGNYTVMYNPISQPKQFYPWATPSALGGGWSPERRCNEISRRLEFYRPDGLVELRTSVENGYNIICVTTEADPDCRIVLTVPPGQDPVATRDRVFSNLTVADSGQQTTAVNTFTGDNAGNLLNQIGNAIGVNLSGLTGGNRVNRRSSGIDLRPFLDPSDGGTGARLKE